MKEPVKYLYTESGWKCPKCGQWIMCRDNGNPLICIMCNYKLPDDAIGEKKEEK